MTTIFPGPGVLPSGTPPPSQAQAPTAELPGAALEQTPSAAGDSVNDLSAIITARHDYWDGQGEEIGRSVLDHLSAGPPTA
jgi:hypothetical protein